MVKKRADAQTGVGLTHGLGLFPAVLAGCLLSACQTRGPAEPSAPPAVVAAPAATAPPVAAAPPVPPAPEARAPARPGRLLELSYAVRPPKRAGVQYWRKLETDVRRLAGVARPEPPIPDFAPLPHEPHKGKPVKPVRKIKKPPQPQRPSVTVDRKRGVLTVRAVADRQRAVADYLRQRRPPGK